MKNIMSSAHKLTKEIKNEFPEVDYKFQLGLCMKYLNETKKNNTQDIEDNKVYFTYEHTTSNYNQFIVYMEYDLKIHSEKKCKDDIVKKVFDKMFSSAESINADEDDIKATKKAIRKNIYYIAGSSVKRTLEYKNYSDITVLEPTVKKVSKNEIEYFEKHYNGVVKVKGKRYFSDVKCFDCLELAYKKVKGGYVITELTSGASLGSGKTLKHIEELFQDKVDRFGWLELSNTISSLIHKNKLTGDEKIIEEV